jgi:hypothetical protein
MQGMVKYKNVTTRNSDEVKLTMVGLKKRPFHQLLMQGEYHDIVFISSRQA